MNVVKIVVSVLLFVRSDRSGSLYWL